MSPVISVQGLGKSYRLRHQTGPRYLALRDVLAEKLVRFGRRLYSPVSNLPRAAGEEIFWALKNVTFSVGEGERVGIIGRNGAGKSTLLKILSRVTDPTTGKVEISGRVTSLLEVGTGFHPELTGRENIYLNGAILGMSKLEIQRRFDEIVEFAEVDRFLDTPVKHYSSGMYVRLAFAVAAHLESEILIVDEVLAVGDISFQKKCLGRMADLSRTGRTLLFVSHNMSAVRSLCTSGLLLSSGRIITRSTDLENIISQYQVVSNSACKTTWENRGDLYKNPYFMPIRFYLALEDGRAVDASIKGDDDVYVIIEALVEKATENLTIGYAVYSEDGTPLYWSYHTDALKEAKVQLQPGIRTLRSRLPKGLFNEGSYELELIGGLHFSEWLFEPRRRVPTLKLEVRGGISDSPYWINKRPTVIAPVIEWFIS